MRHKVRPYVIALTQHAAAPPPGRGSEVGRLTRFLWLLAGLGCVGLGGIGVVVPGLPSTIFFIGAAACFTRSSPRLERWVLGLPGVGQMVRDHRAGLGMPRRAKAVAIASITGFSALAIAVIPRLAVSIGIAVLAIIGIVVVAWHVPTREHVIAARSGDERGGEHHNRHGRTHAEEGERTGSLRVARRDDAVHRSQGDGGDDQDQLDAEQSAVPRVVEGAERDASVPSECEAGDEQHRQQDEVGEGGEPAGGVVDQGPPHVGW